jgi:hypothetical protein
VDDATAEKLGRNNARFRAANDEIEEAATDHGLEDARPVPFICECSDGRCTTIIRLTLDEYREMRAHPRRFAHAPGHEEAMPGVVRPVERTDRYVVVEKLGPAGEAADRTARHSEEG